MQSSGNVSKFFSLRVRDQALFIRCFLGLGIARVLLLTRPFKHRIRNLRQCKNLSFTPEVNERQEAMARRLGLAVRRAARFTPWTSNCLTQALAVQHLLSRKGISGRLYLGVKKYPQAPEKPGLSAHAWVACGTEVVTGGDGRQEFSAIAGFQW